MRRAVRLGRVAGSLASWIRTLLNRGESLDGSAIKPSASAAWQGCDLFSERFPGNLSDKGCKVISSNANLSTTF